MSDPICRKHGDPMPCDLCQFEDNRDRAEAERGEWSE